MSVKYWPSISIERCGNYQWLDSHVMFFALDIALVW